MVAPCSKLAVTFAIRKICLAYFNVFPASKHAHASKRENSKHCNLTISIKPSPSDDKAGRKVSLYTLNVLNFLEIKYGVVIISNGPKSQNLISTTNLETVN